MQTSSAGFTLIEMLVYVAILGLVISVFVASFVALLRTQSQVQMNRAVLHTTTLVTDRIMRDIRNADSIDSGASVLGSSPGVLTLVMDDDGNTVSYALDGDLLTVSENGGAAEALTPGSVSVTSLTFEQVLADASEGVHLELSFIVEEGRASTTRALTGFAVLRGSY